MRFTMAPPKLLLEKLAPLQDLQFCLAQHCSDDVYADWFHRRRGQGETVLMDNGFHETGAPLDIPTLCMYAEKVRPTFVISPDWLGFPKKTLEAYTKMIRAVPSGVKVAVVLQGQTPSELFEFFEAVRPSVRMVCFPFRVDRVNWFLELTKRAPKHMPWPPFVHLLGAKSGSEIEQWKQLEREYSIPRLSLDTTKPIKFGFALQPMNRIEEWRGGGGWPKEDAPASVTDEQLSMIYYNTAYVRRFM